MIEEIGNSARDVWLIGGVALVVGIVLMALLYTINRSNVKMSPAIEPRLQHHIDAQQQYIVQMSSDHREERKADNVLRAIEHDHYLKVLEELGKGMQASAKAVGGLHDIILTREREDSQLRNARHGEILKAIAAIEDRIDHLSTHVKGINNEIRYPSVHFLRRASASVHERYGASPYLHGNFHYDPALV